MNYSLTIAEDNPLLAEFELPPFRLIKPSHVEAAIDFHIARCEKALEMATAATRPMTLDDMDRVLDAPLQEFQEVWGVIGHLKSVCDSPNLREAFSQAQPKVTALFGQVSADERVYGNYQRIFEKEGDQLDESRRRALANSLREFRLSGADLPHVAKDRFKETRLRSAAVSREFSNHVLDATDAFVLWATEKQMRGVPEDVKLALHQAADAAGRPDDYRCGLKQSVLGPVLRYAHDRVVREVLYSANIARASELGPAEHDNGPLLAETLALRQERSLLLGFQSYAEVSLVAKMAETPAQVMSFLRDLAKRARPQAEQELRDLRAFAGEQLGMHDVQAWDMAYVTERMRRHLFELSEEDVRRYFRLDRVLPALFDIVRTLFGVDVVPASVQTWHPSVTGWRIERAGQPLGQFLLDPFARAGKQGGAWMSPAQPRWLRPDGSTRLPLAYIVTNFAAPAEGHPALLPHADVVTLFHEFGHALHHLLSSIDVLGVSGIDGVEWDAVELPSQLMESFAWDSDCLARLSSHIDTGRPLPRAVLDKMLAAQNFQSGINLLRQVEFSLFDMRAHTEPDAVSSSAAIQALLDEVRAEVSVIPVTPDNRFQCSFSHVFSGGYAAGYYSYLWAEVLAADAWSVFEDSGGLDRKVGERYLHSILERGGSRPMSESFREFVGREPSIDALLRRRGIA